MARVLAALPPCASRLIVAGPSCDEHQYRADVVVDALGLIPWAEDNAVTRISWDPEVEAHSAVLATWLATADETVPSPVLLPPIIRNFVAQYALEFFRAGIAEMECADCGHGCRTVNYQISNVTGVRAHGEATHEWRCEHGHPLYRERIEMLSFVRTTP
jgi:hypothetical protein